MFSFRDKLKDHYQDISKALTQLDKSNNGYISISKMQKVLEECGCPLKAEELTDLLNRFPSTALTMLLTWAGLGNGLAHCFRFLPTRLRPSSWPFATEMTPRDPCDSMGTSLLTSRARRMQPDRWVTLPDGPHVLPSVFVVPASSMPFGRSPVGLRG